MVIHKLKRHDHYNYILENIKNQNVMGFYSAPLEMIFKHYNY